MRRMGRTMFHGRRVCEGMVWVKGNGEKRRLWETGAFDDDETDSTVVGAGAAAAGRKSSK